MDYRADEPRQSHSAAPDPRARTPDTSKRTTAPFSCYGGYSRLRRGALDNRPASPPPIKFTPIRPASPGLAASPRMDSPGRLSPGYYTFRRSGTVDVGASSVGFNSPRPITPLAARPQRLGSNREHTLGGASLSSASSSRNFASPKLSSQNTAPKAALVGKAEYGYGDAKAALGKNHEGHYIQERSDRAQSRVLQFQAPRRR